MSNNDEDSPVRERKRFKFMIFLIFRNSVSFNHATSFDRYFNIFSFWSHITFKRVSVLESKRIK